MEYDPNHEWKHPPCEYDPAADPENPRRQQGWWNQPELPAILARRELLLDSESRLKGYAQELSAQSAVDGVMARFAYCASELVGRYAPEPDSLAKDALRLQVVGLYRQLKESYDAVTPAIRKTAIAEMESLQSGIERRHGEKAADLLGLLVSQLREGQSPPDLDLQGKNQALPAGRPQLDRETADRGGAELARSCTSYGNHGWASKAMQTAFELRADLCRVKAGLRPLDTEAMKEKLDSIEDAYRYPGMSRLIFDIMNRYMTSESKQSPEMRDAMRGVHELADRAGRELGFKRMLP